MLDYKLGVEGPKIPDPRDRVLAPLPAVAPFNWDVGNNIKVPPTEDQGSSGSCTEQMFCYMFWIHTGIQLSRKDGYSKIHLPGGGAYMNMPFDNFRWNGQLTRDQGFPDPNPQTEENMTQIIVTDVNRKKWVVSYWKLTDTSAEGVARAIKAYKCVAGAFYVQWPKWQNPEYPQPCDPNLIVDGSHALCLYDWKPGQKIKAMSSWGNVARFHEFTAGSFKPAQSFDFYVMEVGELLPDQPSGFVELINNKGKIGVVQYIDIPENLLYQGKIHKFMVPIEKDQDGKPIIGTDGHIKIKFNEMPIKPVDF